MEKGNISGWFKKWKKPEIKHGELTKWKWMVFYPENLKLGKYTDIASFVLINAKYGVEIEDFVQIGPFTAILSISTIDGKKGKVTIKRNARIGSHCTIMPGVTIGENSIIGSHSFVNRDIPPNVIAWGVPARVIRKLTKEELERRFNPWNRIE